MARQVPPGSGGRTTAFSSGAYGSGPGGTSFGLTPEQIASAQSSPYISSGPNGTFEKLSAMGTGQFFEDVIFNKSPYEQGIDEEEMLSRIDALEAAGLDYTESGTYADSFYGPVDQDDPRYRRGVKGRAKKALEGAALTDVPTSTTNYLRPRTVAAGYDPSSGTVTVVFRDGTFWNYYDVPKDVWITFHNSISKGPMVNRANANQGLDGKLLEYKHGPADTDSLPDDVKQALYQAARTAQIANKTRFRYGYTDSEGKSRRKYVEGVRNKDLPKTRASSKAYTNQPGVKAQRNAGKNPSQPR